MKGALAGKIGRPAFRGFGVERLSIGLPDHLSDFQQGRPHPFAGDGREQNGVLLARHFQLGGLRRGGFGRNGIAFREGHDLAFFVQFRAVGFQLIPDRPVSRGDVFLRHVYEVKQNAAPFDMPEKAIADASPFMRAFDQTRNVGEDEIDIVNLDHTEIWVKRREGIIRYLGLGRADRRQKSRFAGIRKADHTCVRDQFQPEPNRHFDALKARIDAARRPVCRRLEAGVSEAAVAAARKQGALTGMRKVGNERLVVFGIDLRAGGNLKRDVAAPRPGTIGAHAVPAAGRRVMLLIAEIDERVQIFHAFGPDASALPAVAAVGTAEFDKFFPPEGQAAITAVSRLYVNFCLVEKSHSLT